MWKSHTRSVDDYRYEFVGDDSNDRFSLHPDNDRFIYMCVLRQHEGKLVVRDQRDRLSVVDELPSEGKLSELMMNAHEALVKNKNYRWRITLGGSTMDEGKRGGICPGAYCFGQLCLRAVPKDP